MTVLYGGRVSEEIFIGEISTGAKDDLEKITRLAANTVCFLLCGGRKCEKHFPLVYQALLAHVPCMIEDPARRD